MNHLVNLIGWKCTHLSDSHCINDAHLCLSLTFSYVKFKTKQQHMRSNDKVVADTVYGRVKGVKWRSVYGPHYYSFEGIPFAKPPVGDLRFKAPVEPDPWTEVRRCTRVRTKPCQVNLVLKQVQGSEDCLYLNVYTREVGLMNRFVKGEYRSNAH